MTARITPEQEKQFKRFVEDAADRALREIKSDRDNLQRLFRRGGEFQAYVVAGINRFTAEAPSYELAKSILGNDFISPEEIAKARHVIYAEGDLSKFSDTVPGREALEWCKINGMMLVAGPPRAMSLLDIRAIHAGYFYSKEGGWYSEKAQEFSQGDKAEPGVWIALSKEPVEDSLSKNWLEQRALVEWPMTIPNAAEMVWGLTTYRAVRGVYLLPKLCVRTSSLGTIGGRVDVGVFASDGLSLHCYWDDRRISYVGVSASRKF